MKLIFYVECECPPQPQHHCRLHLAPVAYKTYMKLLSLPKTVIHRTDTGRRAADRAVWRTRFGVN